MDLAINYKKNPPKDDFMAEVMDLLGDDIGDLGGSSKPVKNDFNDGDEEFWGIRQIVVDSLKTNLITQLFI